MPSSILKFFNEQDPELHPGQLTWPGNQSGRPVLGAHPNLLLQDHEFEQLQDVNYYKARMFVVDDPANPDTAKAELNEYLVICDHICNGRFFRMVTKHELWPTPADPRTRIWLEWIQTYATVPPHVVAGQEMARR